MGMLESLSGLALVALFTLTAGVALTAPAWLVGRAYGLRGEGFTGNVFVETSRRRWTFWVASIVATTTFASLAVGSRSGVVLLLLAGLSIAAGLYFAFSIGFTRSAEARARRDRERLDVHHVVEITQPRPEVADFPELDVPSGRDGVLPLEGPPVDYSRVRSGRDLVAEANATLALERDLQRAEAEGYTRAEPTEE